MSLALVLLNARHFLAQADLLGRESAESGAGYDDHLTRNGVTLTEAIAHLTELVQLPEFAEHARIRPALDATAGFTRDPVEVVALVHAVLDRVRKFLPEDGVESNGLTDLEWALGPEVPTKS